MFTTIPTMLTDSLLDEVGLPDVHGRPVHSRQNVHPGDRLGFSGQLDFAFEVIWCGKPRQERPVTGVHYPSTPKRTMSDPLFEKEREKFMQAAEESLGNTLFQKHSGELWLRCEASVRKIMRRSPENREKTQLQEIRKLFKRIDYAEDDFFNEAEPRLRPFRVLRLRLPGEHDD